MIPDSPLLYSYRVFNKSYDINYPGLITEAEMNSLDNVNFGYKTPSEIQNWIDKIFDQYEDDVLGNQDYYNHFFLKEFVLKEHYYEDNKPEGYQYSFDDYFNRDKEIDDERFWRFYISNWDIKDKNVLIDTRTLTINFCVKNLDGYYKEVISFNTKVLHIYQAILDVRRLINGLSDNKLSNRSLFTIPIFVHHNKELDNNKILISKRFIRISDLVERRNFTSDEILELLINIYNGLMRFVTLNYKILVSSEKKDEMKPKRILTNESHRAVRRLSQDGENNNIHLRTKSNKNIIINLDDDINVSIRPDRNNVYRSRTGDEVLTLNDYKTQVHGHWHNYWYGSGDNKELKRKWVESYYRNARNIGRSVKEFTEVE